MYNAIAMRRAKHALPITRKNNVARIFQSLATRQAPSPIITVRGITVTFALVRAMRKIQALADSFGAVVPAGLSLPAAMSLL